jgi:hypothetical protein
LQPLGEVDNFVFKSTYGYFYLGLEVTLRKFGLHVATKFSQIFVQGKDDRE